MARSGQLIATVARALLLPDVTVGVYFRAIREAGLLPTTGAGWRAAAVRPLDVSRLLIALLTSDVVREAAEMVRVFGDLRRTYSGVDAVPGAIPSDAGVERLEDALAEMLVRLGGEARRESYADDWHALRGIAVDVLERRASLIEGVMSANYAPAPGTHVPADEHGLGLHVRRSIGTPALKMIADLLTDDP